MSAMLYSGGTCVRLVALGLLVGVSLLAPSAPAYAATIVVTTTADELNADGDCSLREALSAANGDVRTDACAAGSGADTITLPAGTYVRTTPGTLSIASALTLAGAGRDVTVLDGNRYAGECYGPVVGVGSAATATIQGVTIRNGCAEVGSGGIGTAGTLTLLDVAVTGNFSPFMMSGGGISNSGTLVVERSLIQGNSLLDFGTGGGIYNSGSATISASIISGNSAFLAGVGGVYNDTGGTLVIRDTLFSRNFGSRSVSGVGNAGSAMLTNVTLSDSRGPAIQNGGTLAVVNSTITDNVYTPPPECPGCSAVGGIRNLPAGTLTLRNTIVAGNSSGDRAWDCEGTLTSEGYNLIQETTACTVAGTTTGNQLGVDARLGPLQDNGGPTFTHAPLPGSPAIDRGNPTAPGGGGMACDARDGRGVGRPLDGNANGLARCDIGAFELSGPVAFDLQGTFEKDDDGNAGPDGWSLDALARRSSAAKRSGSYSLRLQSIGDRDVRVWQAVYGLRPGQKFDLAAWVNIPATRDSFKVTFAVAWKDASGKELRVDTVTSWSAQTAGWNQGSKTLTAPGGTDHAVVRLNASSLHATVYVDDVTLRLR